MKILFVNSTSKDAKKGYSSAIYPPLGILYLASVLKKAGHEVKVIDDLSTGKISNVNKKAEFIKLDLASDKAPKVLNQQILKKL